MKRYVLIAAVSLLAACQTAPKALPEPIFRTVEVQIPIAVPCPVTEPPVVAYPDSRSAIRSAPNIAERARLYAAGRPLREATEDELRAALRACLTPSAGSLPRTGLRPAGAPE